MQWRGDERRRTSPSVAIAVTGVALSVVVMMLSIAVMLGFKDEVRSRLLSVDDSVTITAYSADGLACPLDTAEVLSLIDLPAGATAIPRNELSGILKTPDDFLAVTFRGDASRVSPDSIGSLMISSTMSRLLDLHPDDRVPACFFIDNRIRTRALTVSGTYDSGIGEHDRAVAYCSPDLPAALLGYAPGTAGSLGIRGLEPEQTEALADRINSSLLQAYYTGQTSTAYGITTILTTDATFFTWLDLLDTNVIVILALMAAVAGFTLISSLFILILERVQTIGLLKSLGADNRLISRTFILMAERLVLKGLIIGNAVALLLILLQAWTHIIPLDPANYYVDFVPVRISLDSILALNAGALVISWLVLMLPAMIISRISPAATMRYE